MTDSSHASLGSMAFWNASGLQRATGGRWLREVEGRVDAAGLTIDSRAVRPGEVFVAVRGERFDGHDFLEAAAAAGAALTIVDDPVRGRLSPVPALLVDDAPAALAALASAYRDTLREAGTKVIAVTGSNGKTTVRRMISAVLSSALRGTQSPRSFNNHLGVPLTLLGANPDGRHDDFVVVEVGTNHPGEIAALSAIVRPDCAVITNVGTAHIGNFETRAAIGREKTSLLDFVEPGGVAVVPGGERSGREDPDVSGVEFIEPALRRLDGRIRVMRFETAVGRGDGNGATMRDGAVRFSVAGHAVQLRMPGRHNVANALAAASVGNWAGIESAQIAEALGAVEAAPQRLEKLVLGDGDGCVTVFNDAYNANPQSVEAAIDTLVDWPVAPGGRRVFVIGDMLELGDDGPELHRAVAHHLSRAQGRGGVRVAVLIGPLSRYTAEALADDWRDESVHAHGEWHEGLASRVADLLRPGDVVLLKASRGMRLERLLPAIEARFGRLPHMPLGA